MQPRPPDQINSILTNRTKFSNPDPEFFLSENFLSQTGIQTENATVVSVEQNMNDYIFYV